MCVNSILRGKIYDMANSFLRKICIIFNSLKKRPQFCPEDANKEDIDEFEFVT